jgi:UDP-glucose 4-epimerase
VGELARAYEGMRVLITGGAGFIGSNLAIRLVEGGAQVVVADAMIEDHGGNPRNLAPVEQHVRLELVDVRDAEATRRLIEDVQVIFSLAGQVSHVDSMRDPVTDLEINCRSQLTLLEACRNHNPQARLVFAASRQQYGRALRLPLTEDHPLTPIDVNGINKIAGEMYYMLYHRVYGVATCSLRLTNTYGPRMQMRHARQGFIPWFVRLAMDEEPIALFGDGSQLRDFNYIDDVVDAFLLAGVREEAIGQVFNLGARPPKSLKEFVETLLEIVGGGSYELVPFPPERALIDIGDAYADYSRIQDTLGWCPVVPLADGLAKMVDYYRTERMNYW